MHVWKIRKEFLLKLVVSLLFKLMNSKIKPLFKKNIVSFICKAIFEILWKSKRDKIKRYLITQGH